MAGSDPESANPGQTGRADAGSARWVAQVLETHWGVPSGAASLRPLASAPGERPLSHTAGLWRVDVSRQPEAKGPVRVFKAQLNAAAHRPPEFHVLKRRVMELCAGHGIPVAVAVPAGDGSPIVRYDDVDCELAPMLPGTARRAPTPAQASAVVTTGLALRSVLDGLPEDVVRALAPHPVAALVEEERWQVALDDALERLLPLAERRTDEWGHVITPVLRQLERARPLLERSRTVGGDVARYTDVLHGDLHRHHFLFDDTAEDRVTALLDFDNLHVGNRLLDLAWTAATAGRVAGDHSTQRCMADRFLRAAGTSGLLRRGEARLLMPLLMTHTLPVVVDIAKDILERDLLDDIWIEYLDLLSPARMAAVHALLAG